MEETQPVSLEKTRFEVLKKSSVKFFWQLQPINLGLQDKFSPCIHLRQVCSDSRNLNQDKIFERPSSSGKLSAMTLMNEDQLLVFERKMDVIDTHFRQLRTTRATIQGI